MRILIIGYGKIGRVKASIWKSLGCEVYVYDVKKAAMDSAKSDGLNLYTDSSKMVGDYILDISTPAGQHFKSLHWALGHGAGHPKAILIEKPLASTTDECTLFEDFMKTDAGQKFANKIFVDESYYSSPSLNLLKETIQKNKEEILSLEIELSKPRLPDRVSGRFFDVELGALGVEAPHMLAILQLLGQNLSSFKPEAVYLFVDEQRIENQALLLTAQNKGIAISLISYLGDFRVKGGKLVKNNGIKRHVKIATNKSHYFLELDPVTALPRMRARLQIKSPENNRRVLIPIDDDHLKNHLSYFLSGQSLAPNAELFEMKNAMLVSKTLIATRRQSRTILLKNFVPSTTATSQIRELIG